MVIVDYTEKRKELAYAHREVYNNKGMKCLRGIFKISANELLDDFWEKFDSSNFDDLRKTTKDNREILIRRGYYLTPDIVVDVVQVSKSKSHEKPKFELERVYVKYVEDVIQNELDELRELLDGSGLKRRKNAKLEKQEEGKDS